ncbi:TIGR02556 family CRISPR-associated protein [Thermovibrio sp.]
MIEAIYQLGKELLEKEKEERKEWYWEEPKADRVLILEFENGKFKEINEAKNVHSLAGKLLYKKVRASRRCNASTPTFYFNVRNPSKSINCLKAVINWLKDYGYDLKVEIDENLEKVLKNHSKNLNPREKILITVKVNGKFPGEIKELVEAFKKGYTEDLGFTDGKCSLCGRKTKVSGKKAPFSFYTIDKIGYISGFSEKYHKRGFPLCFDCFQSLERAKEFLKDRKFQLAKGAPKYQIIPSLVLSDGENLKVSELLEIDKLKKLNLSEEQEVHLSDAEEDILNYLKELPDILTLHFLFVEGNLSQERIRLYIQDVFPSRLKELFKAKRFAQEVSGLESFTGKEFTFTTLSKFFYDKKAKKKETNKNFLELLDRVFRRAPYSEEVLIKHLLEGIREAYHSELSNEKGSLRTRIIEALASYLFVKRATEKQAEEKMGKENLKKFVESLNFLQKPEEKGLFLLGVLVQKLLDRQYLERKSKPFLKKLSSFKLNQRGFEKLLPEVVSKLENYEAFKKKEKEIYQLAAEYFSQSPSKWRINPEKMNFVFALGMGLKEKIYKEILKEEKDDKE